MATFEHDNLYCLFIAIISWSTRECCVKTIVDIWTMISDMRIIKYLDLIFEDMILNCRYDDIKNEYVLNLISCIFQQSK